MPLKELKGKNLLHLVIDSEGSEPCQVSAAAKGINPRVIMKITDNFLNQLGAETGSSVSRSSDAVVSFTRSVISFLVSLLIQTWEAYMEEKLPLANSMNRNCTMS